MQEKLIDKPMFVPIDSLRQSDICSIMSIAFPLKNDNYFIHRVDGHHSRRTMLYFLLSIQLTPNNEQLMNFIYECYPNFTWIMVEKTYRNLRNSIELYQKQYHAEKLGTYWQLKISTRASGPLRSRRYISQYRSQGFKTNELKLYWNYNQIKQLTNITSHCSKADSDAKHALLATPVYERQNSGVVRFIISGIQDAVFQVPKGKQVIVLDFADERMPGGYYLENAITQEEVILYNSDGYRALLDFKYELMDGGYMLPEYGVAYVKRVRFFQQQTNEHCLTDLIVAACYDLSNNQEGLYTPPPCSNRSQIRYRTLQKFQAIIASAIANTEGNGKNTYLLLGPIGTGAFSNDKIMIAELFFQVLNNSLMYSNKAIRYAFEEIWFVSINSLETFKKVFGNT